jgi:invasion protein IalB
MTFKTITKKFNYLFLFLFLLISNSYSEINAEYWSESCNENKNSCLIAIKNIIKQKDKSDQTIASAYIQFGSSKKQTMNLIDSEDKTYKLSEKNINIPFLFVNLPLNVDLTKKPLIQIDDKNIGNLDYLHCNNNLGCKSSVIINDEVINLLKKGKKMTISIGVFGSNQNLKIEFPLRGFSKAYNKLV